MPGGVPGVVGVNADERPGEGWTLSGRVGAGKFKAGCALGGTDGKTVAGAGCAARATAGRASAGSAAGVDAAADAEGATDREGGGGMGDMSLSGTARAPVSPLGGEGGGVKPGPGPSRIIRKLRSRLGDDK